MEPEKGFRRGYAYRRIEAAYYARKFENKSRLNQMVACNNQEHTPTYRRSAPPSP